MTADTVYLEKQQDGFFFYHFFEINIKMRLNLLGIFSTRNILNYIEKGQMVNKTNLCDRKLPYISCIY